jgi:valyl-tRNA synthetase
MSAMESQGRDVKMDEKRVEGYRNFATKLWNATRFAMSNGIGASTTLAAPPATLAVNKWIIGEVVETLAALDKALAELRFDAAANAIYHFVWDQFCDWYLELIKPGFVDGERQEMDAESKLVAGWVLDQILVMLHPFMPFITEELWHALGGRDDDLIVAKWPAPAVGVDAEAKAEVEWLIELVSKIRSDRAEMNVPPAARTNIIAHNDKKAVSGNVDLGIRLDLLPLFERNASALSRMARLDIVELAMINKAYDLRSREYVDRVGYEPGKTSAFQVVVGGVTYFIPLEGVIDIAAEKARLSKALDAVSKEAKSLEARLGNAAFVEKAKPEAIDKARTDFAEKSAEAERLGAALARLG